MGQFVCSHIINVGYSLQVFKRTPPPRSNSSSASTSPPHQSPSLPDPTSSSPSSATPPTSALSFSTPPRELYGDGFEKGSSKLLVGGAMGVDSMMGFMDLEELEIAGDQIDLIWRQKM